MMNYYVYLALARGRSDALLREAEAAGRAKQARLYRQRAGASGGRRSPLRRLFRRLRPAWAAWAAWPGRPRPGLAGRRAGASCCAMGRRWSSGRSTAMTPRCWPTASPGSAPSPGGCGSCAAKTS